MPRLLRVLAPALSLVLLAAACGDDDGTDASPTTSPSAAAGTTDDDDAGDDDSVDTGDDTGAESSVDDAEAEDPPDASGGRDEGLGDPAVFVADLSGGTAVPGPGHASATGRIEAESDLDGNLCFDMVAEGLDSGVTDAHIHEGAAGERGGVVLTIGPPTTSSGATDTWTDVCVPVDDDVVGRLFSGPGGFYADVHTADLPDGAVRGQLSLATIFDLTLS